MKIKLLNTSVGLKPLFDEDFEEKKKLKIGEVYEATIKRPRNLSFHRKYFGLINLAWEYQKFQFYLSSIKSLEKSLSTFVIPYEIVKIEDTKFVEVIPYIPDDKERIPDNLKPQQ